LIKNIDEAFRKFYGTLTLKQQESQSVKRQRTDIEECLKKHFGVTRFFRTGSLGNGTSIRGYSDVDYFACIPTKNLKRHSLTTLQEMRNALTICFPGRDISIRMPAVRVLSSTKESVPIEIVPAYRIEEDKKDKLIYEIPNINNNGGWIRSSPDAHNNYVKEVDKKLGVNKVKSLVGILKAWKYYCDIPIESFYLEMYIAKYTSQWDCIEYSCDITSILQSLYDKQLVPLKDPLGISGSILACSSKGRQSQALLKLEAAFVQAQKAQNAERAGRIDEAFDYWNGVFDGKFLS
jgi:Second Messenger Oligonucleotide or Dinucleotide Synthetase domain